MSRYLNLGEPPAHRCNPPGWWRRWRDGVKLDTRWECDCGAVWRWSYGSWNVMVGRAPSTPSKPKLLDRRAGREEQGG